LIEESKMQHIKTTHQALHKL